MLASLRNTLIRSHVGVATVAILLFGACQCFLAFASTLVEVVKWLVGLLRDDPYRLRLSEDGQLVVNLFNVAGSVVLVACAICLSYLIFGQGPINVLRRYRDGLGSRNHV